MTRTWPDSFADRMTEPLPGLPEVARLMRQGGFRGRERPERELGEVPTVRQPLPDLNPEQSSLTWIGHASYLIRTGGRAVLADPVWSPAIPGRIRRLTEPGLRWDELPPIDAVIISHNHYDHLDVPTIRRLPSTTPILAPAALGRWFTRRGFTDVTELDWFEQHEAAGLRFEFVPTHHWSRRGLRDTNRTLWGGWIVQAVNGEVPGPTLFHVGDSAYGPRFAEIGARYEHIDVAMMPIGAYAPRWFMSGAHADPAEAVRACDDAHVQRMAWMHWGAFVLSQEPMGEPARLARQAWAAARRPTEDLWDLAIGETRIL